jgi:hypothetical protein
LVARVDPFAEPGDERAPHDLVDLAPVDVRDEESCRVRAEVDCGYSHAKRVVSSAFCREGREV